LLALPRYCRRRNRQKHQPDKAADSAATACGLSPAGLPARWGRLSFSPPPTSDTTGPGPPASRRRGARTFSRPAMLDGRTLVLGGITARLAGIDLPGADEPAASRRQHGSAPPAPPPGS
jgi:hypothetical protein